MGVATRQPEQGDRLDVLVIDDHELVACGVVAGLASRGLRARFRTRLRGDLPEILAAERPYVVVLDLDLRGAGCPQARRADLWATGRGLQAVRFRKVMNRCWYIIRTVSTETRMVVRT